MDACVMLLALQIGILAVIGAVAAYVFWPRN